MSSKLPILLYHDLESPDYPNEKSERATKSTVVNAATFESQIHFLAEEGYTSTSLNEYLNGSFRGEDGDSKKILITFDDGHCSNYDLALPILKKYSFAATFFIVTDRINKRHHMSENEICEMHAAGMEIGSHGLTHRYLPLLDDTEIERELLESKLKLESILQSPVLFFAYPGGHFNDIALKMLPETGYRAACSCLIGLNRSTTAPYLLKRIEMRSRSTANDMRALFNPANIIIYQFIDTVKASLRKGLGLQAYEKLRSKFHRFYFFKR